MKNVELCYKEGDQNLFSTHFTYYRISQPISNKMIDKLYFEYRSIGYMILDSMWVSDLNYFGIITLVLIGSFKEDA